GGGGRERQQGGRGGVERGGGGAAERGGTETVRGGVAPGAGGGLDGGGGRSRRAVVAHEGGGDGDGGAPPRVRQRVDHAHLEPAARPHRWEEGREVIGDVIERREPELVAAFDPVLQRQRLQDRDVVVLLLADDHHARRQRVVGPRARGVGAVGLGGEGAALVHVGPDRQAA